MRSDRRITVTRVSGAGEGVVMNEVIALAALIVLAATGTGLLLAGVAHLAVATHPVGHSESMSSGRRPTKGPTE
jgi:hypothetical protein